MGIIKFFDKLEDKIRHKLSRYAVVYALIVGFAVVLFWDGVERFVGGFDFFTPEISIIISVVILLLTGTMVSFFIGNDTIISGFKTEQRIDKKGKLDFISEEQNGNSYFI